MINSDIKAKKSALDIPNSFIMQAPVSSGKTELLIQRHLKLLSKASQPEETITITFTNKAANEIKAENYKYSKRCQRRRKAI